MRDIAASQHIASAGPDDPARDRFVDLVRVGAMLAVVVLHWLSVMPYLRRGVVLDQNVLAVAPRLWPLTWLGDVMALFFFAGGYANWVSLHRSRSAGQTTAAYLARRYRRLLVPTFTLFGVWLTVDLLLSALGAGSLSPLDHTSIGNTVPFGPLWFLGIYLVVIAVSPWTMAAHRRWGLLVPVVMLAGVVAADVAAFTSDSGAPLAVNLLLVWLIPHQLGYLYADGTLRRLGPAACAAMAMAGLAGLALLTSTPYYPRSLVTARWQVLTMDAPTLSLVAAAVWLVGLALLLRPAAERMLADPRRWRLVSDANRLAMPVYLWHMTAYLVAVAALDRTGAAFAFGTEASAAWWWGRPAVLVLSGGVLALVLWLLQAAGRVSRRTHRGVSP